MRKTLPIALIVTSALLTADAYAETGGFFVTAQAGRAEYDVRLQGDTLWWGNVDDSGTALALGIGYEFTRNLGVRAMYELARGISAENVCPPGRVCPAIAFSESTDTHHWSIVAMPRLPLGDGWDLYGTIGAMRWRIEPDHDPAIGRIASDDDTRLIYGAGVEYRFDGGMRVGIEYQRAGSAYGATRASVGFGF
jgi:opacity protein-like surface antigen